MNEPTGQSDFGPNHEQDGPIFESEMGGKIDSAFAAHGEFVESSEAGRGLTLYGEPDHHGHIPRIDIVESRTDGGREVVMTYDGGAWPGAGMRLTELPGQPPLLENGRLSDTTPARFIPDTRQDGSNYDPQSPEEVRYWGNVWIRNLETASPTPPQGPIARMLGRVSAGLRRSR